MKRFKNWKVRIATCIVLLSAASASAFYFVGAGAVGVPVASPGAAAFGAIVTLNPQPVAAGGYGDVILGVETGRDFTGHFCTIAAQVAPANPANAALAALPPPVFPPFYPAAPPGFVNVQFVYRPVNDPVHPGWPVLPGGPNVVSNDVQAVTDVADQFAAFRAFVPPAGAGWPWVNIEYDPVAANATFMEFYKFRIVR